MSKQYEASTVEKLNEAEHFLQALAQRVHRPIGIIDADKVRGFRFANPGPIHYVLLNSARSISLINAMLLLRESGFRGELAILARALKENTSKLEYVVGGMGREGSDKKTENFLREYFADNDRNISKRPRYTPISQKDINRRNSEKVTKNIEFLKHFGISGSTQNTDDEYAKRESDLINIFSNHVHGRYPEMMDVFGEFSKLPKLHGNLESQDIDESLELEFVDECANGFVTGFKVALLALSMSSLIELSIQERSYYFSRAFEN